MNKFQDGFSNGSYDDLLEEYAGGAVQSKSPDIQPAKQPSTQKSQRNPFTQRKSNHTTGMNKKSENSFDVDLKNAFRDKNRASFKQGNTEENSSTHSTGDSFRRGKRFNVNIDYSKTNYDTDAVINNNENQNVNQEAQQKASKQNKILTIADGKLKVDTDALQNFVITSSRSIIACAICVVVSIIISIFALSCVNDVLAINREPTDEPIEVVLPNDADTWDAIKLLDKSGLIKNRIFCNIFAKVMGFDDDKYLPGVYYLTPDMGVEKMLNRLQTTATRGKLVSIVIPEGFTIDQIFERLEKNKICSSDSLYKVLDTIDFSDEYDFIAKIKNKEDRYLVIEGYMYPATYEFEQGADPASVIRKFLDKFDSMWTDEFAAKATELGMTTDEIIRLASVIEKEGNSKAQFFQISSVLHNRLNRPGVYPTLDCDSTWDYIEKYIHPRVQSSVERDKYEEKYWTYQCAGLPAGAICNPGKAAIQAALYPTASKNYYFRHDNKGQIYLADTYEKHQANGKIVDKVNKEG